MAQVAVPIIVAVAVLVAVGSTWAAVRARRTGQDPSAHALFGLASVGAVAAVLALLGDALVGTSGPERADPMQPTPPSTAPLTTPPGPEAVVPAVASMRLPDAGGLTALVAGEVSALAEHLADEVTLDSDPAFLANHPDTCVFTVVVRGLSHGARWINSARFTEGLGAAEAAPEGDEGAAGVTLHQQLLVLPTGQPVGHVVGGSFDVVIGDAVVPGSAYSLVVAETGDGSTTWRLPDGQLVRCAS